MFRFKTTIERKAVVTGTIRPHQTGRIRFQGSWWSARCQKNITLIPGDVVYVMGNQGITLLVEPALALTRRDEGSEPVGNSSRRSLPGYAAPDYAPDYVAHN